MSGTSDDALARLIGTVLGLDPGSRARLRRGAGEPDLLLVPRLGPALAAWPANTRKPAMTAARIAAILGKEQDCHPGASLAEARYHERRLSRLLASEPEVLPERLEVAARFLAAKREFCSIEPFYWLMLEVHGGRQDRQRARWARHFTEAADRIKRGKEKA